MLQERSMGQERLLERERYWNGTEIERLRNGTGTVI